MGRGASTSVRAGMMFRSSRRAVPQRLLDEVTLIRDMPDDFVVYLQYQDEVMLRTHLAEFLRRYTVKELFTSLAALDDRSIKLLNDTETKRTLVQAVSGGMADRLTRQAVRVNMEQAVSWLNARGLRVQSNPLLDHLNTHFPSAYMTSAIVGPPLITSGAGEASYEQFVAKARNATNQVVIARLDKLAVRHVDRVLDHFKLACLDTTTKAAVARVVVRELFHACKLQEKHTDLLVAHEEIDSIIGGQLLRSGHTKQAS
jgi:hypothetical protein